MRPNFMYAIYSHIYYIEENSLLWDLGLLTHLGFRAVAYLATQILNHQKLCHCFGAIAVLIERFLLCDSSRTFQTTPAWSSQFCSTTSTSHSGSWKATPMPSHHRPWTKFSTPSKRSRRISRKNWWALLESRGLYQPPGLACSFCTTVPYIFMLAANSEHVEL